MQDVVGACACFFLGVGIAAGSASPALAADGATTSTINVRRVVQEDRNVRSGTLPNGMRYYVQHAALPANGLSIRLGIDVGSVEEGDGERGFAHFIEHLAFRQTRSAPNDDIISKFARLGLAFGRDQNARTTHFNTSYRLDFNRVDQAGLQEGLRWLRDVADGILLSDQTIASEHGVVIAEEVAAEREARRVNEIVSQFQAPELRSPRRSPIGLARSIKDIDAGALKAFYERWYRPENAVVVIASDRPVEEMEQMVRANFESWQAKGPKPGRAPLRMKKFSICSMSTLKCFPIDSTNG